MARCGCSGTSCSCQVIADPTSTITVTGSGSGGSPYVIGGGGNVTVLDSATIDFDVSGTGSTGSPFVITGDATVDVEDLANLDISGLSTGDTIIYNGTDWDVAPAPTAAPGAIVTDSSLDGDGSIGDPLMLNSMPTLTYTPDWTGSTTDPDIGSGSIEGRYTPDPGSGWVDISIDITFASDTQKGSGLWALSLPVGYEAISGRAQALSAMATYGSLGQVRIGTALLSGGGLINRVAFSNPLSTYGSSLAGGSFMATMPAGGHVIITGRYEREP